MKLKEILNKASKLLFSTPEVVIENEKDRHIIRSYKNKGYMFAKDDKSRLPLLQVDLEELRKSIDDAIETENDIQEVVIHISESGRSYIYSNKEYTAEEFIKKIKIEGEDITKIIIKS